ncbi:aarA [Symbiodinium sp. CCMP2592]|nr:aarA [Symbiodinium sp. CCMP2592]
MSKSPPLRHLKSFGSGLLAQHGSGRKAAKDPTKFAEAEQRLADLRQRTAFGGLTAESESEEDEEDEEEEKAPSVKSILAEVESAMKTFKQSRTVQEHGCAIIRNLACSSEWFELIEKVDGVDLILLALQRFKLSSLVQEQGLGALSNLACKVSLRERLTQADALHLVLIALQEHPDKAHTCAQACSALWNLVADHKQNQATVHGLGITKLVCEAMNTHVESDEVLEGAFGALSNITAFNQENKQDIVDAGGAASICRGMQEHLTVTGVQRAGCAALWGLTAHHHEAQLAAIEANAPAIVCQAMQSEIMDPRLQENGCGALRNLCADNDDFKIRAVAAGGAERVCNALARHEDLRVRRQACSALMNMSSVSPEHIEDCHDEILQADAVSRLCTAIEAHKKELTVVEPACAALRNVIAGAQVGEARGLTYKQILDEDLVKRLVQTVFLNLDHNLVQHHCLEALRHVCSWEKGALLLERNRGAQAVKRSLERDEQRKVHDPVIRERGCNILKGLALGTATGSQNILEDDRPDGLKRIKHAMESFRSLKEVQTSALEALMALAKGWPKEGAQRIKAVGCFKDILAAMSNHSQDLSLLVSACGVIRQLAVNGILIEEARPVLERYIRQFQEEVRVLVPAMHSLAEMVSLMEPTDADKSFAHDVSNSLVAHKRKAHVQAAGLSILRGWATVGGIGLLAATEARSVERARVAMLEHKEDEAVQGIACEVLRRVAASSTHMRDNIIEAGLYSLIVSAQETCRASPQVCRQSLQAAGTLLGFMAGKGQGRQEERMRMMMQSAAKAKAAAGTPQRSGAIAFGKLVKETDMSQFATNVQELLVLHKSSSLFVQDACHVLQSLAESSDEGCKAVQSIGVLPTILAVLKQHRRSEAANFFALRVIWSLLTNTTLIRHAIEAGLIELVLSCLTRFHGCPAVQSAALLLVSRTSLQNQDAKAMYIQANIIPLMRRLLEEDDEFLRGRCLGALANLASNNSKAVERMPDMEEAVVEMLCQHDSEQLQCRCLQLLWALLRAARSKRQKPQVFCSSRLLDAVLDALAKHSKSENLQVQGMGFLWNLTALGQEQKRWVLEHSGLRLAVVALETHADSRPVQHHGLELLRSLCCLGPEARKQVQNARAVDFAKTALVMRGDPRILCAATALLGNLACGDPAVKRQLFDQDIPREILSGMEDYARDVGVQVVGAWALGNFVGVSRKRARQLYELGGKDRVFLAMSEYPLNDSMKMYGTAVIRRLELVQDLTLSADKMDEDDEEDAKADEITEGKSFAELDKEEPEDAGSASESSSEDPELRAKIQALAKQTQGQSDVRGGVKLGDDGD